MTQRKTLTDRNSTRRDFLRQAGFATATVTVALVPRHVLGPHVTEPDTRGPRIMGVCGA